jgi:hypothetical protein
MLFSTHCTERFCEEELKDASVAVASGMTPQQADAAKVPIYFY